MNTAVNSTLNNPANLNVVHESEAQRQHARVKLPGKIRFIGANREIIEQRLYDISAGGFSFEQDRLPLQIGSFYKGKLLFQIDSLTLALDVEFQVESLNGETGRAGCEFHNLKPRDISTLRHLISAHLSGELVTVGDLLSTLQRDNFAKARKGSDGGAGMNGLARLRAVTFSLAILLVGLAAFGLIARQIYNLYFVTHADAAMVSVPHLEVTMPREGTVQSLVGADGRVEKGAPIATFSATMLEMLKGNLSEEQLDPKRIEQLFGQEMKGTLTSPCNCNVVEQLVADGQYASKGSPIFVLAPVDVDATIDARFPYRKLSEVTPGAAVQFQVAGDGEVRSGKILSTSMESEGLDSNIRSVIQPDQPLSSALAGRPVEVRLDDGPSMGWFADKARAAGL